MITGDGNLIQLYDHFQPPGATLYAGVDCFPVRAIALPLGMYAIDHRGLPLVNNELQRYEKIPIEQGPNRLHLGFSR